MLIELMDRLFPRICGGAYRSHCDHHELDFRPVLGTCLIIAAWRIR